MSPRTKILRSRKVVSVIAALVLSLCLLVSAVAQTAAVTTADEKVDKVKNSILQVVMTYQADNSDVVVWSSGTCFLINPTTAISCAHIFDPSINKELEQLLIDAYGPTHTFDTKYVKNYQILVNGGVPVNASLRKINLKADYSILKLDETVARPTVTLGFSKDLKITQQIYTLGFPSTVANLQDSKTYTTDQVTITGSTISNISTTNGVDYITHNANISNGNSGGPLVDESGRVVGINLYKTEDDYFLAAAIDQVAALLDDLDIEYTRDGGTPEPSNEETTSGEETTAKVTEAATTAAATTARLYQDDHHHCYRSSRAHRYRSRSYHHRTEQQEEKESASCSSGRSHRYARTRRFSGRRSQTFSAPLCRTALQPSSVLHSHCSQQRRRR